MRKLPEFDTSLFFSIDFINSTSLAKKAFRGNFLPEFPNILREIIEQIYILAKSCHLAEFTEHGLPHICSVVKRISDWGDNIGWLEIITPNEASALLLAAIIHDIGMLTQNKDDLRKSSFTPKDMQDTASWVRSSHCDRIWSIIERVIIKSHFSSIEQEIHNQLFIVSELARAHSLSPSEFQNELMLEQYGDYFPNPNLNRLYALSSIVAVADGLDEDAERCDTKTLIENKQGVTLNKAHWIRHSLINERIEIVRTQDNSTLVEIHWARIENGVDNDKMLTYYRCMKRQLQSITNYNIHLEAINACINTDDLRFDPDIPDDGSFDLSENIRNIADIGNWQQDRTLEQYLPEEIINTISFGYIDSSGINLDFYNDYKRNLICPHDEQVFLHMKQGEENVNS